MAATRRAALQAALLYFDGRPDLRTPAGQPKCVLDESQLRIGRSSY
jgi:hypothetical protein